jgi:hypothetical protein
MGKPMKTRITSMAAMIAAIFLVAVPASAQKVTVDWDHKADFTLHLTH